MIVMKFGGTSVESAEAIRRVTEIVRARLAQQPVVVVSAMGKTTNTLLAIAQSASGGSRDRSLDGLNELRATHLRAIEEGLNGEIAVETQHEVVRQFAELEEFVRGLSIIRELTPRTLDAVAAYGELLSSRIVAAMFKAADIPAVWFDSRKVVLTDDRFTQATPLLLETNARVNEHLKPLVTQGNIIVMGGFIGATSNGVTTTLGRGGSDYSASLIGAGIGADEIQIWTDVDGMLTADPRIAPGGHRVKVMSFAEAAELAYFGAKVLHPATVLPAIEANVPVRILNSKNPSVEGTIILREAVTSTNPVKSIACKPGITLINISSTRMLMAHGFLRRIFEVFDRHEVPVDIISTSEVSVSLTIDNDTRLLELSRELSEFAEVSAEGNCAIVSLVGENIRNTPGIGSVVFSALRDINIRMISQGASRLNISLVLGENDLKLAVERLHAALFSTIDPKVFST